MTAATSDNPRGVSADETLARRIKEERIAHHWGYKRLAIEVTKKGHKMHKNAPWLIENKNRSVSSVELEALAAAFGITVQELLLGRNKEAPKEKRVITHLSPEDKEKLARELFYDEFRNSRDEFDQYWLDIVEAREGVLLEIINRNLER